MTLRIKKPKGLSFMKIKLGFQDPPMPKFHWMSDMIQGHWRGTLLAQRMLQWELATRTMFQTAFKIAGIDHGFAVECARYGTQMHPTDQKTQVFDSGKWQSPTQKQLDKINELYFSALHEFESSGRELCENFFFAILGVPVLFRGETAAMSMDVFFGVKSEEKYQKKRTDDFGNKVYKIKSQEEIKDLTLERVGVHSLEAFLIRSPFPFGATVEELFVDPPKGIHGVREVVLSLVMLTFLKGIFGRGYRGVPAIFRIIRREFNVVMDMMKYSRLLPPEYEDWRDRIPV